MPLAEQNVRELNINNEGRQEQIASAIRRAKAMNTRLRLMKERNEQYLAERRIEEEGDETEEL